MPHIELRLRHLLNQALARLNWAACASCMLCVWSLAGDAFGQAVIVEEPIYRYPQRIHWANYDPYYVVTSRVYAQADLIRAQSEAAVNFSQARNLNADAYSKELDNWIKEVRVYWDRKQLREKKKLELDHARQISRMRYLNDQKWRNSRLWDRLKNHSELSEHRIRNGDALNFLLARLASSTLPYQFDPATSRFSDEALNQLELDERLLTNLNLKQGPFKFAANQTVDKTIDLWPFLLRWDEFAAPRKAVEDARRAVVEESEEGSEVSVASIQKLQQTLMALTNAFHRSPEVASYVKQRHRYRHFSTADRFLQELDREILQLERTGDIRPFRGQSGYAPETDGGHLVSLLCFMNRNGVEFAPAKPGSEFAYHNLFVLMRGLYLTVADEDEALQPKNLGELIE